MEKCIKEARATEEGCCFFFDGECGGHASYPEGYSGKIVPFRCVKDLLDDEAREKKKEQVTLKKKKAKEGLLRWSR